MSRWTASWRLHFEKGLRKEPDGSFIVRPFGVFGRSYALPDNATKDRYIAKRIRLRFTVQIIFSVFVFAVFMLFFFAKSIIIMTSPVIFLLIGSFMLPTQILLESAFTWRMLRMMGGHPVPRTRWRRAYSGIAIDPAQDQFSSAKSGELGGIFILLVALTALLASILLASYFGPPGRDAGMPYLLFLLVLTVTGTLAIVTWRELWRRERRNGSR